MERETMRAAESSELPLHRISEMKLITLMVLTLGLYQLAWFWHQWAAIRRSGQDVWVFPRTLFAPLSFFNLMERVTLYAGPEASTSAGIKSIPGAFLVINLLSRVVERISLPGPAVFAFVLLALAIETACLVSAQRFINRQHEVLATGAPSRDQIDAWVILGGLFGLCYWGMTVFSLFSPGLVIGL